MNYHSEFSDCFNHVIDSMKRILYNRHNDIFERIDFSDDNIFLEPLLYTYVRQEDNKWLDCILYGFEKQVKGEIAVFSNRNGIIYIPNVGYFITNIKSQVLSLRTDTDSRRLFFNDTEINYEFEELLYIKDEIEIVRELHPLFEEIFVAQENNLDEILVQNIYISEIQSIIKGLKIIESNNPSHYSLLKITLKKVLLFSSKFQNSFALMTAFNMIFLNVAEGNDEIFYADHISHEGAHLTFFALTYESKFRLFKHDFNTPIGDFLGEPGKYNGIYLYFHGLFTFVEITKSLKPCIDNTSLSDLQNLDVRGRFIFHMQRFKIGLEMFESIDIFTDEGLKWFNTFNYHFKTLENLYNQLFPLYDLTEQPYDFNSKIFAKLNIRASL